MDQYRPNEGYQPCLNCAGFHYGRCYHPPRNCWHCQEWGHIQRYCQRKKSNRRSAQGGEALPGTRHWCEKYGLNQDQEMRIKVFDTLKVFPGAAIFLDDACILPGKEVWLSHNRREYRYERPLADRMTRARSRSPSRERDNRRRDRSRTPLARYRRSNSRDIADQSRSNAVVFEAANPRQPAQHMTPAQRMTPAPRNPFEEQENMRSFSNRNPFGQAENQQNFNTRAPFQQFTGNTAAPRVDAQAAVRPGRAVFAEVPNGQHPGPNQFASQHRQEEWIEDAYFVLGVDDGANEEEIAEAFEQRIWEIDQQRMGPAGQNEDKWSSSVRMLEAARRQLVGY